MIFIAFFGHQICSAPCFSNKTPDSFWRVTSPSLRASCWAGHQSVWWRVTRGRRIHVSLPGSRDGDPVGVYSVSNCIFSGLHQPLTFYLLAPQLSLICAPVLGPTPRLPHKSPYCLSSGPFDSSEGFSLYVCMMLQCSGKLPPVFIYHGETGIAEVMMVT